MNWRTPSKTCLVGRLAPYITRQVLPGVLRGHRRVALTISALRHLDCPHLRLLELLIAHPELVHGGMRGPGATLEGLPHEIGVDPQGFKAIQLADSVPGLFSKLQTLRNSASDTSAEARPDSSSKTFTEES